MTTPLFFLKLGGSLITNKNIPHQARSDVLKRLADEIARALTDQPGVRLLLGHGSGSFGHIPAKKYQTRDGVATFAQWRGLVEVWHEARALNTIVMEVLHESGVHAMAFPPSAQVITSSHKITHWDTTQIAACLDNGILPVVYGDVVFDQTIGGTILSTEEQFEFLAAIFKPARVLLAGIEKGVWMDFPRRKELLDAITPRNLAMVDPHLESSESPDVTGGMRSKVHNMMNLVTNLHCQQVLIFSGLDEGNVFQALTGRKVGTCITLDKKG